MIKFFKSYMLEGLKDMKLDAVEYTLLMWLYNLSKVFEIVTLNFSQIQEKLPFVIKRSQFDRAVLHLIECGYIDKISDKRNVSYKVNEEKFFSVMNPPAAEAAEEVHDRDENFVQKEEFVSEDEKENRENSRKNVPDLCELRNQKRHIDHIVDPISENVNKNSDLFSGLPAENLPAVAPEKKRKVFVIPTPEEIADHMYNYLTRKGFQNLNSQKIANEAERFFCYYNSNGWKVGKQSMKDWKSAASGWLCRNDNLSKFCNYGGYDNTLEEFQKMINPDGFKFYK